ncbi:hypothetical protein ENUP19_0099G0024 [Entamoeba nuttalli]|uniref:Protein tyrosine kinase domain containing protein n=2 Tax=Entamoeba nuttalli TaxID=412467 RepID=K2H0Q3_ENTNP|nr:protein tyrosine kinase domain containing protein [Entamoeba nuttalli P19]EKE39832.1 protein tyrosine kinase domain containing protein [Entamoeba nuttalli P19]|eukprot:XP_008857833.1 protein tyrosine kinase domain containing protein [Entamoeba nuttalli P19]
MQHHKLLPICFALIVLVSTGYPCNDFCLSCIYGQCEICDKKAGMLISCGGCQTGYYPFGMRCEKIVNQPKTCESFLTSFPSKFVINNFLTLTFPDIIYFVETPCFNTLPYLIQQTKGYYYVLYSENNLYSFSSNSLLQISIQNSCSSCVQVFDTEHPFYILLEKKEYVLFLSGLMSTQLTIQRTDLYSFASLFDFNNQTQYNQIRKNYYGNTLCYNHNILGHWFRFVGNKTVSYQIQTTGSDVILSLQTQHSCIGMYSNLTSLSVMFRYNEETLIFVSGDSLQITVSCVGCIGGVCSSKFQECLCEKNFVSINGECTKCGNGVLDDGEECELNQPFCNNQCKCIEEYYYVNGSCVRNYCGNYRLDPGEECDGGSGCDKRCKCTRRYKPNGKVSCEYKYLNNIIFVSCFVGIYALYYFIVLVVTLIKSNKISKVMKNTKEGLICGTIIPFNKEGKRYIPLESLHNYVVFNPPSVTFNDSTIRPDVDEVARTKICITNCRKETLSFILHGHEEYKYELVFEPSVGNIRGGQTVVIKVKILIRCTTIINNKKIPITLEWGNWKIVRHSMEDEDILNLSEKTEHSEDEVDDDDEVESSESNDEKKITRIYTYLNLNAESAVSTKLDYEEVRLEQPPVGAGTFGIVYRAKWRKIEIAVKVLKTDMVDLKDLMPNFEQEAELMERLRCQNIVNFIGTIVTPDTLCIVTEFCTLGSLRKYMKLNKMTTLMKVRICQDIAIGMGYLHQNDIIHHDLKTDNVLVYSKNPYDPVVCKVSDFGTSQAFIESSNTITIRDVGTPMYMAPEVHRTGKLTLKSDVFSFAICMLEIWLTHDPYPLIEFHDGDSVLNFVCSGKRIGIPKDCVYREIIKQCWRQKPERRPGFSQINEMISTLVQSITTKRKEEILPTSNIKSPVTDRNITRSGSKSRLGIVYKNPSLKHSASNLLKPRARSGGKKGGYSLMVPRSTSAKSDEEKLIPINQLQQPETKEEEDPHILLTTPDIKTGSASTGDSIKINDQINKSTKMFMPTNSPIKIVGAVKSENESSDTEEVDFENKIRNSLGQSYDNDELNKPVEPMDDMDYLDFLDPHRLCKREATIRRNATMINYPSSRKGNWLNFK